MTGVVADVPSVGQLVTVRGRRWVVSDVQRSDLPADLATPLDGRENLLSLTSIEDDGLDEELQVVWELEIEPTVHERSRLPTPQPDRLDEPRRLDAFLDAVRWGAVTSADRSALQAPFRSGIDIEDYQLDPLVRALGMPRTSLLIADDVGLGKTIEAGLVVQELILRHRARTVLIVCPASLTLQWRDEMAAKFGLDFRIVDASLVKELRRSRGLYVNPFTHYPRLIVSIDWLKRERPMRLLHDVLPPGPPTYPRTFDLLIVDEVHSCAPSGTGRYATDSLRTKAIRALAPHCEHRLFLSATPHNGYPESFTALLELLDDQRFARGVSPEPAQLARVMVRRLKSELPPDFDGTPRFPTRMLVPLEVAYGAEERRLHGLLQAYSQARAAAARHEESARVALDFVATMLKKRLFSSPEAFARTLAVHEQSLARAPRRERTPTPRVLREMASAVDDAVDTGEDDPASFDVAHEEAFAVAATAVAPPGSRARELLGEMRDLAEAARYRDDAKMAVFLPWLDGVARRDGAWTDERVIVFTEYRDTQRWLHERLVAHGYGGDRVALLHGGLDPEERELTKKRFLASPADEPVRVLLATDAASEGIDLQRHCHRLVHWEIPWNPNRLEQRNGRIDRHGQRAGEVVIHHFVSAGYGDAPPGSLEGDLQFLAQAVRKVEAIRTDLGSVGPVIAYQVTEAMLGRRSSGLDTAAAERTLGQRALLRVERDLQRDLERLTERLRESASDLGLTPLAVERVVRTGLALARQQDLESVALPVTGEPGFRVPALTGSWARAIVGLAHPLRGYQRPITFDRLAARDRDDVVYVHLGHPLVQQCLRLLRAEIWAGGDRALLSRVTARVVDDAVLDTPAVVVHGRLVVTGESGRRLHEEVIVAGGRLREGRFARFDTLREAEQVVRAGGEEMPSPAMLERLTGLWPRVEEPLARAFARRAEERARSLDRMLEERQRREAAAAREVLEELARGITGALDEPAAVQLELFTSDERRQLQRDIDGLRDRLAVIPRDIKEAEETVRHRYADPTPRHFPAAVTFYVPRRLAR